MRDIFTQAIMAQNQDLYLKVKYDFCLKLIKNDFEGVKDIVDLDNFYRNFLLSDCDKAYQQDKTTEKFIVTILFLYESDTVMQFIDKYDIDTSKYTSLFEKFKYKILDENLMDRLLDDYDKSHKAIFLKDNVYILSQEKFLDTNIKSIINKPFSFLQISLIEEQESVVNAYMRYPEYVKENLSSLQYNNSLIEKIRLSLCIEQINKKNHVTKI